MDEEIRTLKSEKNAVILAHNYQPAEIQDIADLCGDSLELSIKAARTDADIIVFCGVHFMAETASILSPDKKVLLPVPDAGCPMADMADADKVRQRQKHLGSPPTVTYVNSTAEVKAISDICCTSANAVDVVNSLDAVDILMVPDRNLGQYTSRHTGKNIHLWPGFCPYHDTLTVEDVSNARAAHPGALFLAHPECRPEILDMADSVESTSGMIRFAGETDHDTFIIGTETGLLYPLSRACPEKKFYAASDRMYCTDMKKITLNDIKKSLETLSGEVKVPEEIRKDAFKAVRRMIDLKRS